MSFLKNIRSAIGLEGDVYDDEYDDVEYGDDDDYEDDRKSSVPLFSAKAKEPRVSKSYPTREEGKVVNLHGKQTSINILKPTSFDEVPGIADSLKGGQIILINTSALEKRAAQRLLDFMSGSCYALGGDVREVDNGVYVFSPPSVEVDGSGAKHGDERGFMNWSNQQ